MTLEVRLEWLLSCVLFPLWIAAGFADWAFHRHTGIENTSGVRESRLHLLLFAEISVAVLVAVFFDVTAATLLSVFALLIAHQITSLTDTKLSQPRRYISPLEQLVHGVLDLTPWFAFAVLLLLHVDALGARHWIFATRESLPASTGWLIAGLAGGLAAIIEEFLRCRRAVRASVSATSRTEVPRPR